MRENHKGIAPAIILIVIAVIVGGWFLWSKSNKQVDQAEQANGVMQEIDMSDWKSYSFQDITFKYPAEWTLNTGGRVTVLPPGSTIKSESPKVTFFALDNPNGLTIPDYEDEKSKENGHNYGLYSTVIRDKTVTANEKMIASIRGYYVKNGGCEPSLCDKFSFTYNHKIYVVSGFFQNYEGGDGEYLDRSDELRPIFNQILSSLEFTN